MTTRTAKIAATTTVALLAVVVLAIGAQARQHGAPGGANGAAPTATASLPASEAAALRYMREEEKLARDVYDVLGRRWNDRRFARISRSEQMHMNAVLRQLERYGIADPAADTRPGEFRDAELQRMYDRLVARGRRSRSDALAVGRTIERADIADLDERLEQVTTPSIERVFTNLRAASERHLRAFGG